MKKYLVLILLLSIPVFKLSGQYDQLLKECMEISGSDAKYIKDFNIQLGETDSQNEFRYKATLSLRKKTKYRFAMCTSGNSKGKLILDIKDDSNKTILKSYDQKTGQVYSYVDLKCNKNGIYQIYFDFTGGHSGSGVSLVSMIQ